MLSRLGEDLEGDNHALDHRNLSSNAWMTEEKQGGASTVYSVDT